MCRRVVSTSTTAKAEPKGCPSGIQLNKKHNRRKVQLEWLPRHRGAGKKAAIRSDRCTRRRQCRAVVRCPASSREWFRGRRSVCKSVRIESETTACGYQPDRDTEQNREPNPKRRADVATHRWQTCSA